MKAIELIKIGLALPRTMVSSDGSNERALLSIIEQAGEGLDMLKVLSSSEDHVCMSL
jgi:hypothetical protein